MKALKGELLKLSKDKLLLFVIAVIVLIFLHTQMGWAVLIVPIIPFFYIYFVRPKFVRKSNYWMRLFKEERFVQTCILVIAFAVIAYAVSYISSVYVESLEGPALPDIILNNLGPIDLSFLLSSLTRVLALGFLTYIVFIKPTRLLFFLEAASLLLIVRGFTMVLTQLGAPAGHILPSEMIFTKDLFFSGHVSFSFLGFLIFRDDKLIRYFLLAGSIIIAFTMLAMHLHYSIDIVAAFFFTYGVYHIASYVFKTEYELYKYKPE